MTEHQRPFGNNAKFNIFLSLASSYGDKISSLQQCVQLLKDKIKLEIINSTSFYEVESLNNTWSICAVINAFAKLPPKQLYHEIKVIENFMQSLYDKEEINNSNKLFELELLFYEDLVYESNNFNVPNKNIPMKASILVPLLEIAPDLIHPKLEKSITKLYELLPNPEQVLLYGTNV